MEELINIAKKNKIQAEVYSIEEEEVQLNFESNKIKSLNTKQISGTGLRVINKKNKVGFSSSTNPFDYNKLWKSSLSSSKFGESVNFEFPHNTKFQTLDIFDKRIEKLSIEKMKEEGEKVIEKILNKESKVKCNLQIEKSLKKVSITNTSGLKKSYKKTILSFFLTTLLVGDNDLLEILEGGSYSSYLIDLDKMVKDTLKKLNTGKREEKIRQGKMPVIITPKAMYAFGYLFSQMINGKMLQKGTTPLIGKKNEKIFDEKITIFDDGIFNFGINTSPFDDEGVARRRTVLVEKGVLKNFIFDLNSADSLKEKSTGNAGRSFSSQPMPITTTLCIEKGNLEFEKMVKDVKEGLLIDQVMGYHQSNPLSGEFSFNVDLGFKIEKGEIIGRVKDIMVSGNIFQAFNKIVGIEDGQQLIYGNMYSPSIYFSELNISGGEK